MLRVWQFKPRASRIEAGFFRNFIGLWERARTLGANARRAPCPVPVQVAELLCSAIDGRLKTERTKGHSANAVPKTEQDQDKAREQCAQA